MSVVCSRRPTDASAATECNSSLRLSSCRTSRRRRNHTANSNSNVIDSAAARVAITTVGDMQFQTPEFQKREFLKFRWRSRPDRVLCYPGALVRPCPAVLQMMPLIDHLLLLSARLASPKPETRGIFEYSLCARLRISQLPGRTAAIHHNSTTGFRPGLCRCQKRLLEMMIICLVSRTYRKTTR